jgi:hypothetical protein
VTAYFLHIGKTGGAAIRHALLPFSREFDLRFVHHFLRADALPARASLLFTVRSPVDRYVSGFNSRLRMGRPRGDVPWTATEAAAFSLFTTPNALAEALGDHDPARRRKARLAMHGISHLQQHQHGWFPAPALKYLTANRRRIKWIGATETLQSDFERLKERLGLPPSVALPFDAIAAHRTPEGFSRELSEAGRNNIAAWYAEDIRFVSCVMEFRRRCETALQLCDHSKSGPCSAR